MFGLDEVVKENRRLKLKHPLTAVIDDFIYQLKQDDSWGDGSHYTVEFKVGNVIRVKEVYSDIQSQEKKCLLEYKTISGSYEQKEVEVEVLADKNKVVSLAKYGMDVSSNNAKYVLYHLNNELRKHTTKETTMQMGVIPYRNKISFIGQETFLKGKRNVKSISVKYNGKFALMVHGDREEYMQIIHEEICPSIPLSVIMMISLSAPLVGYIGKECRVDNILTHISGDSSTGKSTALKFAVSLFGSFCNTSDKKGLFCSWNSTDNALMEMLAGNMGIPLAIDEIGMSKKINFSSLIYRLVEGKEKERMRFGEGNENTREWHTSIISSGEHLMNDYSDQATGQNMRIIQINGCPWTRDAKQVADIMQVITNHYGFLGLEFVKKMFSFSKESLLKAHEHERGKEIPMLKCGRLNERTADTLALIMLAGRILKQMNVNVNLKMVRNFLVDVVNESRNEENSMGEKALEKLKTQISNKQNVIERRATNGKCIQSIHNGEIWGVGYCVGATDEFLEVAIPIQTTDAFLRDNGFLAPEIIYQEWLTKGYIKENHKKTYTHVVTIKDVKNIKCIRVRM